MPNSSKHELNSVPILNPILKINESSKKKKKGEEERERWVCTQKFCDAFMKFAARRLLDSDTTSSHVILPAV